MTIKKWKNILIDKVDNKKTFMSYEHIKHNIYYINLKNENYDLKKDILLKDYNLNIKNNEIEKLKKDINNLKNEIKINEKYYKKLMESLIYKINK